MYNQTNNNLIILNLLNTPHIQCQFNLHKTTIIKFYIVKLIGELLEFTPERIFHFLYSNIYKCHYL